MLITKQDPLPVQRVFAAAKAEGQHGVMVVVAVEFTDSYLGAAGRP